jgi:hypothetical protein
VNLLLILINVCFHYFTSIKSNKFYLDGQACIIFTVIIHPDFFRRAHSSQTFMNFLLTLIYEGLENKYPQFKLDTGMSNIISLIIFFRFFFGQYTHTQ